MSLRNILLLALAATALASPASKSGSPKGSKKAKHTASKTAPHVPISTGHSGTGSGSGAANNGTTSGGGGLKTTFPTPKGSQNIAALTEGGNKDAVFILEEGATISNVVIGPNNGEGIHCLGSCTINNVWFQDVCEDAITFKQTSGTSFVNGGGAQNAEDKVRQHNGVCTVAVKDFYCKGCSKMYRSCGNCKSQTARHATFENVRLDGGKVLAAVNGNLGDGVDIKNSCVLGGAEVCEMFEGNSSGAEPKLTGKGPDGKVCVAEGVKTSGC
uniref:Pectate lyase n=1 Tax=Colletotrichum fructicola (strain Nara gc5) TaxID=1213859 RepID=L2G6A4_COLFN